MEIMYRDFNRCLMSLTGRSRIGEENKSDKETEIVDPGASEGPSDGSGIFVKIGDL